MKTQIIQNHVLEYVFKTSTCNDIKQKIKVQDIHFLLLQSNGMS